MQDTDALQKVKISCNSSTQVSYSHSSSCRDELTGCTIYGAASRRRLQCSLLDALQHSIAPFLPRAFFLSLRSFDGACTNAHLISIRWTVVAPRLLCIPTTGASFLPTRWTCLPCLKRFTATSRGLEEIQIVVSGSYRYLFLSPRL